MGGRHLALRERVREEGAVGVEAPVPERLAAPKLREAHKVDQLRAPEEVSVAGRVMGFLSRIRARATAS